MWCFRDYLESGLDVVFVGTSVASASANRGHYYAGPGNRFWEFLWEAGLTGERLLVPEQDATVCANGIGLTDVVKGRAASSDSLLRASDYGVRAFLEEMTKYAPHVVAFNGQEAARRVGRFVRAGEVKLGVATWSVGASLVYVLPSSSGSSADTKHYVPKTSKGAWWRELGTWLAGVRHR